VSEGRVQNLRINTRHLALVTRRLPPGYLEAREAARFLEKRWLTRPRVGIVLGSGLGGVVRNLRDALVIPYKLIPFFPQPTVPGHVGTLHLGSWRGVTVAALEGRMHLYEGFSPQQVVFPTRVLALLGVETLVLTCAAGGIGPQATLGSFMLFRDHLNFQGQNPLAGPQDPHWGTRFVDLSVAYDPELRRKARRAAAGLRLKCFEGVYAALPGPSFETPAEIRALKKLGADAVGMSIVPEVIAARQRGLRVLAIAAITNRASGLSRRPLRHEEVMEASEKAAHDLGRLLYALAPNLMERDDEA